MYMMNMGYGYPMMGTYPKSELLKLLIEAMKDERYDRKKYKMLMDMTKKDKIKKQIQFAYEDEGKHYNMFQSIYKQLTGELANIPEPKVKKYNSLIQGIEDSINGELEAVELYRKIKAMLPTRRLRDMLYEIITDEQEHATRFVYVYAMEKN